MSDSLGSFLTQFSDKPDDYEIWGQPERGTHVVTLGVLRALYRDRAFTYTEAVQRFGKEYADTLEYNPGEGPGDVYEHEKKPKVGVLERLREVSWQRQKSWHTEPWTVADWTLAMCGEAGEAANFAKKIRRIETGARNDGDPALDVLIEAYLKELADTVIYAELCARKVDGDLGVEIVNKFNATSEKFNFEERI